MRIADCGLRIADCGLRRNFNELNSRYIIMKTRLVFFTLALLLLPPAGFMLNGAHWNALAATTAAYGSMPGALSASTALLVYTLIVNHVIKRITGNAPFDAQRGYFIQVSIASAVLGWLLSYLNLFVASWTVEQSTPMIVQFLLYTPAFAMLAPSVLVTRALLGSFPGVLRALAFRFTLPQISRETGVRVLLPLALTGLVAGAALPAELYWLIWLSPLLLLVALQLLWHEKTIFNALKSGNFGRLVCTALSGILVCNIAAIFYQSHAFLQINLPNMQLVQFSFVLFGLLCLQLGDVLAAKPDTQNFQSQAPLKNSP